MRYVDEFRQPAAVQAMLQRIRNRSTRVVRLMEFCGGHTHAILKLGLRQLLPSTVQLLSGPGCPVCVTSGTDLDRALALAYLPGVILTTFGDMLRVPGNHSSLQEAKAQGADVRIVYSVLDALSIARNNPQRAVIFLGVGFETTAPTVAAAILQAQVQRIDNLFVLALHKLTPPAMRAILDAGEVQISGIIGPGHVTTVIGAQAWDFLPNEYGIACSIAGFEPLDILQAIDSLVTLIEANAPAVTNPYSRSASVRGNAVAQQMMQRVFEVTSAEWRGLGTLPNSGLALRREFAAWDATRQFDVKVAPSAEPQGCRCGEVLRAVIDPPQCPLFGKACTPERPIGPCMVSGEGACAAYMQYGEGR